MKTEYRNQALLEVIRQGLLQYGQQQSQTMLGDRTTYIGISDIGRYSECPRAAVAAKQYPMSNTLPSLLTLQRGHWFEDGIATALKGAGLRFLPQLEISIMHDNVPIQAHLDFTLLWDNPYHAVRILEVKSTDNLPDSPRASHAVQAQGQVCLLRTYWNEPVFSLRNEQGEVLHSKCTFPDLCKIHFGIALPRDVQQLSIESWLLYVGMRDSKAFGPFSYSQDSWGEILGYATAFWRSLQTVQENPLSLHELPHIQGFYPLCSYCQANADCPKFPQGDYQPQWQAALAHMDNLKEKRSALDANIKEIEAALKQAHKLSGTADWITTGTYRFRTTNIAGRRTLDKDILRNELTDLFQTYGVSTLSVDDFLKRCEREGVAASRLSIAPIH